MLFTIALYASLSICLLGVLLRILRWFTSDWGPDAAAGNARKRFGAAVSGVGRSLFSRRIFAILKTAVWEIMLQGTLLKVSPSRWFFHFALFFGFTALLLMHALDDMVTAAFFPFYASTLSPFLFLRNLFGALCLAGICFFIIRRLTCSPIEKAAGGKHMSILFLLLPIFISGFLLEAAQIFSAPIFDEMVEDYMGSEDPEEIRPLKAYWSENFGVIFPQPVDPTPADTDYGRQIHEENCAACHSRPHEAFLSYALSGGLRPAARTMNRLRADVWLWHLHCFFCFLALALLPFTKLFHMITVPINLMVRAGSGSQNMDRDNRTTQRAIGFDACTHCGICTLHCSIAPDYHIRLNPYILPSKKLKALPDLFKGRQNDGPFLEALAQGCQTCTDCMRCEEICPSGLPLQDLWTASLLSLRQNDYPEPYRWIQDFSATEWADRYEKRTDATKMRTNPVQLPYQYNPQLFSACVQCTTCSNVCPVVATPEDVTASDLTPQQIMNLLRLGLPALALGSRMLWNCTTCYLCQEHCPQGIPVTDLLYDLRRIAVRRLQPIRPRKMVA